MSRYIWRISRFITAKLVNKALEDRMQMAQDISSLVLSLRKKGEYKCKAAAE